MYNKRCFVVFPVVVKARPIAGFMHPPEIDPNISTTKRNTPETVKLFTKSSSDDLVNSFFEVQTNKEKRKVPQTSANIIYSSVYFSFGCKGRNSPVMRFAV